MIVVIFLDLLFLLTNVTGGRTHGFTAAELTKRCVFTVFRVRLFVLGLTINTKWKPPGFHEDLHASTQTQDQVQRGLLLDVVV